MYMFDLNLLNLPIIWAIVTPIQIKHTYIRVPHTNRRSIKNVILNRLVVMGLKA